MTGVAVISPQSPSVPWEKGLMAPMGAKARLAPLPPPVEPEPAATLCVHAVMFRSVDVV